MVTVRGVLGDDGSWRKADNIGHEFGLNLVKDLKDASAVTIPAILRYSTSKNRDLRCMGTRTIVLRSFQEVKGKKLEKMELGDYAWLTYSEVYEKVLKVSAGILELGLKPKTRIAMLAETRADWFICAVGCLNVGITVVTLYTSLHDQGIIHGINETEVDTIITSYELLPRLIKILPMCENIRRVIVLEDQLEGMGDIQGIPDTVKVLSFSDLRKMGSSEAVKECNGPEPEDIAIIMYTSGSTGDPKGVELTHRNIFCAITSYAVQANIGPKDCYLAYLPLAHVMELGTETAMIAMGASIAYSSPHTLTNNSPKIKHGTTGDARMAKPTCMSAVPLILDRIIKGVNANAERQGKLSARVFTNLLRYKQYVKDGGLPSQVLDVIIFNKVKAELGGCLKMMVVGGAPLSSRTHKMIQAMFGCTLQVGYGATETAACATSMDSDDIRPGHAGAPNRNVHICLEDWEEGGYTVRDKPRPRGQIVVGGDCVATGYFKMAEQTKLDFFEKDGKRWFRTGDIGEFDETGCLYIIDRMKDLIKLQHGEFVSLGNVEAILKTHSLVDNICVFADGNQNYVVAIVVPAVDRLKKLAGSLGKPDTLCHAELCLDSDVINAVVKFLQAHARSQKLNRSEVPAAFHLSADQWTPENGLVTAALKLRRVPLAKRYHDQINDLYAKTKTNYYT